MSSLVDLPRKVYEHLGIMGSIFVIIAIIGGFKANEAKTKEQLKQSYILIGIGVLGVMAGYVELGGPSFIIVGALVFGLPAWYFYKRDYADVEKKELDKPDADK
jgi:hypothetical protein